MPVEKQLVSKIFLEETTSTFTRRSLTLPLLTLCCTRHTGIKNADDFMLLANAGNCFSMLVRQALADQCLPVVCRHFAQQKARCLLKSFYEVSIPKYWTVATSSCNRCQFSCRHHNNVGYCGVLQLSQIRSYCITISGPVDVLRGPCLNVR